ncbi:MAG: hypothetical protein CVU42_09400 [Chloroflexi bacterium HGW-Chloroflexi-4]|jgi:hypothetical protein|nr:MAG: hypothetical protein CVU42_09400 [Chloroflexi bacterium HGW-Chloroflexi-4]
MKRLFKFIVLAFFFLNSCASSDALSKQAEVESITPTPTNTIIPQISNTPTFQPTSTQLVKTNQFYKLNIKFICVSKFCSIEFLNPEIIQNVTNVEYDEQLIVSFEYPFINIDRHAESNPTGKPVEINFVIHINPDALENGLRIRSRHAYEGGSSFYLLHLEKGVETQITWFDHYFRNPINPDENPEVFVLSLESLKNIIPITEKVVLAAPEKMLWAVYYPWIGWKQGLECTDHPLLLYEFEQDGSRTIETYRQEILLAKRAGIDGFFVSWFNDPVSNHELENLLIVANEMDFKIAIYLESLLDNKVNPDIGKSIIYAARNFGDHPAYMRINGLPVIMLYGYQNETFEFWKSLFDLLHEMDIDAAYIPTSYNLNDLQITTGLHQYINLTTENLNNLYSTLSNSIKYYSFGKETKKYFVATVTPGFNNCPYDNKDQFLMVERDNGDFFREQFNSAVQSNPDWIMITSWNEFGENTHIAPSETYGEIYLEIAKEFSDKWKNR